MSTVYPHHFKVEMIRRMTGPNALSANHLAKEVTPCQSVLSSWLRQARAVGLDTYTRTQPMRDSTTRFTPDDKLRLVLKAETLSDEELGAFLREHGLHEVELKRWKLDMLGALNPSARSQAHSRTSSAKTRRANARAQDTRIKQLERELRRKDKALAETAALLVLQKKVQNLWGDEDENTTPNNAT